MRRQVQGKYLISAALCLAAVAVLLGSPSATPALASTKHSTSQNVTMQAEVTPSITYDAPSRTIEVRRPGSVVDLGTISNAVKDDSLLQQMAPGEWLLKVNIRIFEEVKLELHGRSAGGDVDWLKLKSDPSGFVAIDSSNGIVSIMNTRITSWDTRTGLFDLAWNDGSGRAYIVAKNRSAAYTDNRMDVIDSEIAYLGFLGNTAYGISWRVMNAVQDQDTGIMGRGLSGTITGSKFHHNYFGVYVYGVGDMQVAGNEFYDNVRYGFDAHTLTQRTALENNYSHDNGTHGIIFADRSTENVVRNNRSLNNKGHGIMLHESSDNNRIEDNTVSGNDDGVPLFESSHNVVARNIIRGNRTGIRIYGRAASSTDNLFEDNEVSGSDTYGAYLYDVANENTFRGNRVTGNDGPGFYLAGVLANVLAGNTITGNEDGVRLDSNSAGTRSAGNQVRDNDIQNNLQYGILSYVPEGTNIVDGNRFLGNTAGEVKYIQGLAAIVRARGMPLFWLGLIVVSGVVLLAIINRLLVWNRRRAEAR